MCVAYAAITVASAVYAKSPADGPNTSAGYGVGTCFAHTVPPAVSRCTALAYGVIVDARDATTTYTGTYMTVHAVPQASTRDCHHRLPRDLYKMRLLQLGRSSSTSSPNPKWLSSWASPFTSHAAAKVRRMSSSRYPDRTAALSRLLLTMSAQSAMTERLCTWDDENPDQCGQPTEEYLRLYKEWGKGQIGYVPFFSPSIRLCS
jgi:hypothetical protein